MELPAYRRAAVILLSTIAAGGYAGLRALSPWFSHSSGVDLAPAALAGGGVVASSTGMRPAMATLAGAPAPLTLLAMGVLIAAVGFALRLGLLPVLGAAAVWLARSAAAHSETLLLSGRYTRDFLLAGGGSYQAFLTACWVTLGLMLLLAAQLTYAGHLERASDPDADPGILDTLGAVQSAAVGRFAKAR